jgi:large repetitive protein
VDQCPVLPATGGDVALALVAAAIVVFAGVLTVVLTRRRATPILVVVVVAGIVALAAPAQAAPNCPPTSTSSSTSIASSSTSSSTTTSVAVAPTVPTTVPPTTGSSTTSSTSTTAASTTSTTVVVGVAPVAGRDLHTRTTNQNPAGLGQPFSVNVFANDELGDPPATVFDHTFAPVGACAGFAFNQDTGLFSGTPTTVGQCVFNYALLNSAGLSGTDVVVHVENLEAPQASGATRQVTAGDPLSVDLFRFGQRGVPQATITSHTFAAGGTCAGLAFNPATGVLSGTPAGLGTPTGDVCAFTYTLSNAAGSASADVIVTIFPAAVAPVATANSQQRNVGGPGFSVAVLNNDFLGHPLASITSHTFDATAAGCAGLTFEVLGFVTGPASAGVACSFDYTISNTAGSSTATVTLTVVIPP